MVAYPMAACGDRQTLRICGDGGAPELRSEKKRKPVVVSVLPLPIALAVPFRVSTVPFVVLIVPSFVPFVLS